MFVLDITDRRLVAEYKNPMKATFGSHGSNAWIAMFDGAYVLSSYKTNAYHVRCLRGQDVKS